MKMSMGSILEEFKDGEIMHQIMEDMDMEKHGSHPSNQDYHDAMRKHSFSKFVDVNVV